jgi:hypothetical protein
MILTTRDCDQCDSNKFDVIEDKYFTKRKNEKLFMILNVILYPVLRGSYLKPKVKLICEACHRKDIRDKRLKGLGL